MLGIYSMDLVIPPTDPLSNILDEAILVVPLGEGEIEVGRIVVQLG